MYLRFTQEDAIKAHDDWGCNCGPSALAAALGKTLDEIRGCMGPFESRGYTNVTNMREAIANAGGRIVRSSKDWPTRGGVALARIQFGGPWIVDGKPLRWAACHTHWVAAWRAPETGWLYVFDCNGGIEPIDEWEEHTLSRIIASIKKCDGTWTISHCWEVEQG